MGGVEEGEVERLGLRFWLWLWWERWKDIIVFEVVGEGSYIVEWDGGCSEGLNEGDMGWYMVLGGEWATKDINVQVVIISDMNLVTLPHSFRSGNQCNAPRIVGWVSQAATFKTPSSTTSQSPS